MAKRKSNTNYIISLITPPFEKLLLSLQYFFKKIGEFQMSPTLDSLLNIIFVVLLHNLITNMFKYSNKSTTIDTLPSSPHFTRSKLRLLPRECKHFQRKHHPLRPSINGLGFRWHCLKADYHTECPACSSYIN